MILKKNPQVWVYDLEQFKNFHSCYAINVKTLEEKYFIIHPDKNDLLSYYDFLMNNKLIGYNNINYDSYLTDFIIKNINKLKKQTPLEIVTDLYWTSKFQIEYDNYPRLANKYGYPQADLFLIHHYNNKARITGLKWIEFYLRMENIQDLPIHPDSIVKKEQFDDIISYNKNDALATLEFYKYTEQKKKFHVRKKIGKTYDIENITNMSDVKIGEMINRYVYSQKSGRNYEDYQYLRTNREYIDLKDCMPLNIIKHFKTKLLQDIVKELRNKKLNLKNDNIEYIIHMEDLVVALKQGGLHSEDSPGIFESNDEELIVDIDVALNWRK